MTVKTTLTMHENAFREFADYLKAHEYDISAGIDDFDCLKEAYFHVFGDYPRESANSKHGEFKV